MKKFIFLILLLTPACVSSKYLYTDENNNPVYQVTCNGALRTYGDCLAEIGRSCPMGFNIIMSDEKQTGTTSQQDISGRLNSNSYGNANFFGAGNNGMASALGQSFGNIGMSSNTMTMGMFNRYMIYTCK